MKLINSSVIVKEQESGIDGVYKQIEWAGRHCYKSLDKITGDSAKEFVDRMIKLGHGAMLEHGTIYLTIDGEDPNLSKIQSNPHTKVNLVPYEVLTESNYTISYKAYITTNLRVLVENNLKELLCYQVEPTEHHEKRITAKFICDRGVSHEFVRHRVFSFAQESQRYCNYSKDKFGNELTFIKPTWFEREGLNDNVNADFEDQLIDTQERYFSMLALGLKPQEVRAILPNAIKTELVMTGFESDWEHFFELRCSGAAHPDAKKLADELKSLINVKNIELNSVI
jgi:thymidylate synthase (FAD)